MESRNVATPRFRSRFSIVNSPGRQLGDLAMFNFSLHPYARWLGDGSLGDVPGFNIGESEAPPGNGASLGGMFAAPPMPQYPSWPRTLGSTLRLQNPLRSAPPSDPPGLWVTPANNLPGFRLNPQDESTSFNLNETDGSPREGTWPDGMPPDAGRQRPAPWRAARVRGNRRVAPTFIGGPSQRQGSPPMLRRSEVLGPNAPNRIRAARGSIPYRERAPHPDS